LVNDVANGSTIEKKGDEIEESLIEEELPIPDKLHSEEAENWT
jgi:hypothetical protein